MNNNPIPAGAGGAAAAGEAGAGAVVPYTRYQQYFAADATDPYGGDYAAYLREFRTDDVPPSPATLYAMTDRAGW
jgi:hypothetical protein